MCPIKNIKHPWLTLSTKMSHKCLKLQSVAVFLNNISDTIRKSNSQCAGGFRECLLHLLEQFLFISACQFLLLTYNWPTNPHVKTNSYTHHNTYPPPFHLHSSILFLPSDEMFDSLPEPSSLPAMHKTETSFFSINCSDSWAHHRNSSYPDCSVPTRLSTAHVMITQK